MSRLSLQLRSRITTTLLVVMMLHALVGQAFAQVFCIEPNGHVRLEQGWNGHCADADATAAKSGGKHCIDLPATSAADHEEVARGPAAVPDMGMLVALLPALILPADNQQRVDHLRYALDDPPPNTSTLFRKTTVLLI